MNEKTTMSGVLNIDKPAGVTSHDVVAHVRSLVPGAKAGHTGTLDPFATGVLLVAIGSATRLIQWSHSWDKEYAASFTLGATSDTDDVTGKIAKAAATKFSLAQVQTALSDFIGTIEQIPPAYSAVKVKGKKLYELARAGVPAKALAEAGETRARKVTIYDITIQRYEYPELEVRIRCSTGTYIRALARDVGKALGTGAFVSSLRRTRVGPFDIQDSVSPAKLSTAFQQYLHSPATLVSHLPAHTLTSHNIQRLRHGQGVVAEGEGLSPLSPIALFQNDGALIGIGRYNPTTGLLSPLVNL